MSLSHTLKAIEALDSAYATASSVASLFPEDQQAIEVTTNPLFGTDGKTDLIQIMIQGTSGKTSGGKAPTLGIIGRLGGIGARPTRIGLVSDGDGAVAAIAIALKLAHMRKHGDALPGDVVICTHVSTDAPTQPHEPVDFMGSPVSTESLNENEVSAEMDAILSIDTTKGNRILNHKGYAISPTVKEGYILRVDADLVRIMEMSSGQPAVTFPLTTQDVTPYGNGIYHLNSIMQPSVSTTAPTVGVAISTVSAVPGCGTGASDETDIAAVVRFAIEVAKEFGYGILHFYDKVEYERLLSLYGPMHQLQQRKR